MQEAKRILQELKYDPQDRATSAPLNGDVGSRLLEKYLAIVTNARAGNIIAACRYYRFTEAHWFASVPLSA